MFFPQKSAACVCIKWKFHFTHKVQILVFTTVNDTRNLKKLVYKINKGLLSLYQFLGLLSEKGCSGWEQRGGNFNNFSYLLGYDLERPKLLKGGGPEELRGRGPWLGVATPFFRLSHKRENFTVNHKKLAENDYPTKIGLWREGAYWILAWCWRSKRYRCTKLLACADKMGQNSCFTFLLKN